MKPPNMKQPFSSLPKLRAAMALVALCNEVWAQDSTQPAEIKRMCPAAVATVMVGKVACSASLCNTGAAQGGWLGLVTQVAHAGGAIDAASFTAGFGAQLATALKQTGCFTVLDAASVEAGRKEMEVLGRPLPPPPAVDFFVRSDITKAELVIDESGLLGFKTRTAKSSLGLDTKLVSAVTGAVSEAGSYHAVKERKSSGIDLGIYRSNDDKAGRATPFADVSLELISKATLGLTTQIISQAGPSRASPGSAPQPVAVEASAASAPQ